MRILSKEVSSIAGVIMSAPVLAASRAASFTRLDRSAPEKPAQEEEVTRQSHPHVMPG
jgi:hypothetical protein